MVRPSELPQPPDQANIRMSQAHVCISGTSRAGAELGYDVSVIRDGIGDRDIPGASAKQLVDVSMRSSLTRSLSRRGACGLKYSILI